MVDGVDVTALPTSSVASLLQSGEGPACLTLRHEYGTGAGGAAAADGEARAHLESVALFATPGHLGVVTAVTNG
jgi:hypothetical protein